MRNEDPHYMRLLMMHVAFIVTCVIYAGVGVILDRIGAVEIKPVLPPDLSMIVLAPGVLAAVFGIFFFRKSREEWGEQRLRFHLLGAGLVEVLPVFGIVVFFLTGGEKTPLFSSAGLAILVLMMNFPRNVGGDRYGGGGST